MSIGSIASAQPPSALDGLRLALRRGKTGCLTARTSDGLVRQVYVSQGEIFAAHAPEDGSWLVRRLINHGALTDRQGASFLRSIERGVSYEDLLQGQVPQALLESVLEGRFRQTLAEFLSIEGRAEWTATEGIFVANVQTGHDTEALLAGLLRRRQQLSPILHRREPLTLRPGPANPARPEQARLLELCEPAAPIDDLLAFSPYEHWDTAGLIIDMIVQGSLVSDEGLRIAASRPPEVEDAYGVEELFSIGGEDEPRAAPPLPISFLNALAEPVEVSTGEDFGNSVPDAFVLWLRHGSAASPAMVVEEPSIMPRTAAPVEAKVLPFVPLEESPRGPRSAPPEPDAWADLDEPTRGAPEPEAAVGPETDQLSHGAPHRSAEPAWTPDRDGPAEQAGGVNSGTESESEAESDGDGGSEEDREVEGPSGPIAADEEDEGEDGSELDENGDPVDVPEMVSSVHGQISLVNFRRDPIPAAAAAPEPPQPEAPSSAPPEDLVQTAARYLEAAAERRAARAPRGAGRPSSVDLEAWLGGEEEPSAPTPPAPKGAWKPTRDADIDPSLLALFEDQDDLRGLGDGQFSVSDANLDRVDMRAEMLAALAQSSNDSEELIEAVEADAEAEAEAINLNFGPPPLRDEEARSKLGVAVDVLAKLAAQIDASTGPGSGSAAVQVLLEGTSGSGRRLFSHVNTALDGRFDLGLILSNLRRLPEAERRTVLDASLLDLVERALAYACETLPAERIDDLLIGIAGYQQRLRG